LGGRLERKAKPEAIADPQTEGKTSQNTQVGGGSKAGAIFARRAGYVSPRVSGADSAQWSCWGSLAALLWLQKQDWRAIRLTAFAALSAYDI